MNEEKIKERKEFNEIVARIISEFSDKFGPVIQANADSEKYELILVRKTNLYLVIRYDMNVLDLKCSILEWLSRSACKGGSYRYERLNEKYQDKILECINNILKASFSHEDIDKIYTYLGNGIHHSNTIKFVQSDYDMNLLHD